MPIKLVHDTVNDFLALDLSDARGYEFTDALNKARGITGRRFDFANKLWLYEATPAKAEEVIGLINPECSDELRKWVVDSKMNAEAELTTPLPEDADVRIPWGRQRMPWQPEQVNDEKFDGLLNYQRAAVDHCAQEMRAVLADDMGLGKTLEAISTVEEWRLRNLLSDGTLPEGPRLVVCPASVMGGWVRELNRWLEPGTFDVQLVDGYNAKKRHKQVIAGINNNAWVIVNWEALRIERQIITIKSRGGGTYKEPRVVMKEPLLEIPHLAYLEPSLDELDPRLIDRARKMPEAVGWLAVLADEAHKAKNPHAKQTRGLWRTFGNVMLALTGTPIMNSPDEIWALLRWLWPEQYTSHQSFWNEYVDYYENPHVAGKAIVTGVKNPDGLRFELKGRLVRRTQGEVRDELPGRRRIYLDDVQLLPEQRKLYDEAEENMWLQVTQAAIEGDQTAQEFLDAAAQGADVAQLYMLPNGAARTVRCRQIIETPANLGGEPISGLIDDFEERFEASRPQPWVVFCEFKTTCDVVAKRLRDKYGVKVAVYTGDTSPADRTKIEDEFQMGQLDCIVGTIAAMQVGITLTRGYLQYWMSRDWVPDNNEQGEARQADRLGQQNKTMIFIPQPQDTVAVTKVAPVLRRKEGIVRTVVQKDHIEEVHQ
jgi:SNF2 family DNA or RNA helicase